MEPSLKTLFLGWWMLGQLWMSRGESFSKPSISVHPKGMVALGGNVSIHCQTQSEQYVEFYLSKDVISSKSTAETKDADPHEVIFPIFNAKKTDGGKYWCLYHFKGDQIKWSPHSDTVYINLTDPTLPKPSIKMIPTRENALGLNVTIQCQGAEKGLTFALQKGSMQIAFQATDAEMDTAEFSFVMLRMEDAGSYTCQYHHRSNPFVWSEPSEPAELVLRDRSTATIPAIIPVSIAAGLLFLVLLLLLVCVLQKRKKKGSIAEERSQPMSKPLQPDAGEEPDEVSYAVLNHQSKKTKQASSLLDRCPEACVYASVAKNWDQRVGKLCGEGLEIQHQVLLLRYLATNGVIFLGWWLTRQRWMARGQYLLCPSVSVSPSAVVPVGGNVTISCKSEMHQHVTFELVKEESASLSTLSSNVAEKNEVTFLIANAKHSDEGTYYCIYREPSQAWSPYSNEVHINIREQVYPKPSISLNPNKVIALGENATIRCKSELYRRAEYSLIKEGALDIRQVKTAEWEDVVFSIANANQLDAGIYWCEYGLNTRYSYFSEIVYINLTDHSFVKPTIRMRPKGQHALGANVTILCQGPENDLTFFLYKSMDLRASQETGPESNMTKFYVLMIRLEDAGSYTCQYHKRGNPFVWSVPSKAARLVVRDASLFKPSIKVRSTQQTPSGFNVTIECQGPETDLIFSLHKSMDQTAPQPKKHRNVSTFQVFMIDLEDARHYACQYHHKSNPFVWSEPSDPLELVKKDRFTIIMWASIAAGSLLLVLLLLLLTFKLCRKKMKRSTAEEANQPVTMPLEPVAEADPNEVSYAVLNHYSLKIKQAADPDRASEHCLYASVAKDRTRNQEEPIGRISQEWGNSKKSSILSMTRQYYYPKPTIDVSSGEVVLGGTAIIYCVRPVHYQEAKIFRLFKVVNSKPVLQREVPEEWNVVNFSIPNATQSLEGSYVCNYCSSAYNGYCSEYSDRVSFKIIGQLYPKPSIAVIPNGVVTEGQKVSILCENQGHPQAEFFLHKGQPPWIYRANEQKAQQGKATFSFFSIQQFHAGNYQCKYCYQSDTYTLCSDYSEQVQINMRDPNLPKPAIKVRPKEQIFLGSNITIECWAPERDLNFSLYNSSGLIASQMTKAGRNMTEFIFSMAGLEYAGNYTCQYYVRRRPFLWSEPSDPVELLVANQTQGINDSVGTTTIILASTSAGFLLLLLLLLPAFVLCRKRRKGKWVSKAFFKVTERQCGIVD
ncbi:immunoglobulin superfamily member 1-like [Sceloporus undulatus]|uniref:immunoglobulin superfamily member 1-like n=1 Tax=Sceloporus undulatus TaxID=8520 RepID=UPI001C4C1B0C|nr:immunoglobulin superfamily member 1-like [Sceloporus undulatus]